MVNAQPGTPTYGFADLDGESITMRAWMARVALEYVIPMALNIVSYLTRYIGEDFEDKKLKKQLKALSRKQDDEEEENEDEEDDRDGGEDGEYDDEDVDGAEDESPKKKYKKDF